MISAQVSTAELPGEDGCSEDRVFCGDNVAMVLDGVSVLGSRDARSGWYPDELGQRILALLSETPALDLREAVAHAISDVATEHGLIAGASPSSTVATVRWDAESVEGLVLADSPIVVFGVGGGVDVLSDGRHDAVVAELRSDVIAESGHQARNGDELRALIRATRPAKLSRMNQAGGYWIAETVPEAGRRAIVRRWPRSTVTVVLAMTDGVSCGVDDYRRPPSWPAALSLARKDGLPALLETVHQAEASDLDARRWPRPKAHDDKAAALIELTDAP